MSLFAAVDLEFSYNSAARDKFGGPPPPHISEKHRKLQFGLLSEQKEDA